MALSVQELHERALYPIVRVRTEKAGGSGTVIYSRPSAKDPEEYNTFVLTNHHVIASNIKVEKRWDSVVKRKIDKEYTEPCTVEVFNYVKLSWVDAGATFKAQIVAYDEQHDLALLKLDSPTPMKYVARVMPLEESKKLKMFEEVYCSGCSLGHAPIVNKGLITFLDETIENKRYMMTNANSIFGNSGGALFYAETGDLIGVPSRVSGIQIGYGVDIITWMSFSAPVGRIYEWIDEQELQFLYDDSQTVEECFVRRSEKEKQTLRDAIKSGEEDE